MALAIFSLSSCSSTTVAPNSSKTEKSTAGKMQAKKKNTTPKMREKKNEYWKLSSELRSYPDLTKFSNMSLEVSISKNITLSLIHI